jgi:hypothetical protein
MNQNIWGSHLWFSLHTITFNYPIEPTTTDKEEYKQFFINLQNVIPCSVCKKNYKRHINEHPIDNFLNNRKDLVYWLIDMHNMVNGEIGKKILSYDIVIKKYEKVYGKKIKLDNNDTLNNTLNNTNEDIYNKSDLYSKYIYGIIIFFFVLLIINYIYFLWKCKKC